MSFRALSGLALLILVGVGLASFGPALWGSNFGTVVPDRVYRSGQLSEAELERRIERHGIRAIVNLRGPDESEWYRREAEVARRHGVALVDIDLVPERLPPRPAVVALLDSLDSLPKPILIHCSAGADRTGFASVVAKMALGGATLDESRGELSFRYGHLPLGPAAEIGRIFDQYEDYLRTTGAVDRFVTFESWARSTYVPYAYHARLRAKGLPSRVAAGERIDLIVAAINTSPAPWTWSTDKDRGIKLGIRLREGEGDWIDYDRHGPIDRTVLPGESLELEVPIWAPRNAGRYELKLDLVDEHVTWFEDQGSLPLVRALVVEP